MPRGVFLTPAGAGLWFHSPGQEARTLSGGKSLPRQAEGLRDKDGADDLDHAVFSFSSCPPFGVNLTRI